MAVQITIDFGTQSVVDECARYRESGDIHLGFFCFERRVHLDVDGNNLLAFADGEPLEVPVVGLATQLENALEICVSDGAAVIDLSASQGAGALELRRWPEGTIELRRADLGLSRRVDLAELRNAVSAFSADVRREIGSNCEPALRDGRFGAWLRGEA